MAWHHKIQNGAWMNKLELQASENAKRLREIVFRAKTRIEDKIIKAVERGDIGTAAALKANLEKELFDEYVRLGGDLDKWGRSTSIETARAFRKIAIADLPVGSVAETWTKFSQRYADQIWSRINPQKAPSLAGVSLNEHLGSMLSKDINILRKTVADVYQEAALSGMSPGKIKSEIRARITSSRPHWEFVDKSGRKWKRGNYFSMLNKTVSNNAARASYIETASEAGYELYIIDGFLSPNSHPACVKWQGKIVSAKPGHPVYPYIGDAEAEGLFHPNCNHSPSVVLDGEITEEKAYAAKLKAEQKAALEEEANAA